MSSVSDWLATADRFADWSGVTATVMGLGASGFAAADALYRVGAVVEVIESSEPASGTELARRCEVLQTLGVTVRTSVGSSPVIDGDLVIPSPVLAPHHSWLAQLSQESEGVQIWSGEQLAWQLRPPAVPWLTVTGTNGKTTTVQLIDAMLREAGHHSLAAGNIGLPMAEAIFVEPQPEVFVVELSSFQLHFMSRDRRCIPSAHTSALLNLAPDHLEWHGSFEEYRAAKARVFEATQVTIVYNRDDPEIERMAEAAEVVDGCRAVGFTLGVPARSMVGVVDEVLVDRAFVAERATHAVEIVSVSDLPDRAPHVVADTLAAAAVARSFGAPIEYVRAAATAFTLDNHRGETVSVVNEVRYVDDSKATNVHAADVALSAHESVVWIAGGLAKGGRFDDLVQRHRAAFRAVVVTGADQDLIADAVRRHAPEVPVISVPAGETDPMSNAVAAAANAAHPRDTVLLAPACASLDQYPDYRARGRAFADAVARLRR